MLPLEYYESARFYPDLKEVPTDFDLRLRPPSLDTSDTICGGSDTRDVLDLELLTKAGHFLACPVGVKG
jgi:hypothetical protein